jgi:elongation factor Ts
MSAPEVSAKVVMQLRASTGLPMMKCKEALEACGGDFEKAVDWLRKKGLETAAKKADRVMKEGRVALRVAPDGSHGVMVEVGCETEPVAVGPDFKALVEGVLEVAWRHAGRDGAVAAEAALAWKMPSGETVDATVKHLVAKIGENMALRRVAGLGGGGRVAAYLHFNHRVGVLTEVAGPAPALAHPDAAAFLSDLGKHIAFAKPAAVSRADVAKELVDKELEIYREQAKQDPKLASKPPQVVEKILLGKLDKFFADRCLLEQPWVMDDKQSVKAVLEEVSRKAGGALSVRRFALFQVGAA